MLDLRRLIDEGLGRAGDRPVLLMAPFAIPDNLARDFFRHGRIAGVVANEAQHLSTEARVPILGRWLGPHYSRLRLEAGLPDTLLFLGTSRQIGGRILLESTLRGVRRIVYLGSPGKAFEERSSTGWLISKALHSVVTKLSRARPLARLARPALACGNLSFEHGYRDVLERGAFLRLPPEAFDPGYALLSVGTLGPGGAERQLVNTARGIAREGSWRVGVSVENLTSPLANFHEATLRDSGIAVHQLPAEADVLASSAMAETADYFVRRYATIGFHHVAQSIFTYALFLREQRPYLLHTWMDACNVRAGMAAALVGVPRLVLSGRSVAPDHFSLFQPYLRDGYKAIMGASDPVILNNSRAGAVDYERWLGITPGKIKTVHNGFEFPDDISARRPRARAALGLAPTDVVLGGLMRCSEEKRPDLWLEVAAKFVQSGSCRRAVLYGDGPMRDVLLRRVESRSLAHKIALPGVTDDPWTALAGFDIFALTSRMEGLPNVLVEAQAAGIPVVSPAVGGVEETVLAGKTGCILKDDRAATLARHCIELAKDEALRRAMGAAGATFARARFSARRMIDETLSVYTQQPSINPGSAR